MKKRHNQLRNEQMKTELRASKHTPHLRLEVWWRTLCPALSSQTEPSQVLIKPWKATLRASLTLSLPWFTLGSSGDNLWSEHRLFQRGLLAKVRGPGSAPTCQRVGFFLHWPLRRRRHLPYCARCVRLLLLCCSTLLLLWQWRGRLLLIFVIIGSVSGGYNRNLAFLFFILLWTALGVVKGSMRTSAPEPGCPLTFRSLWSRGWLRMTSDFRPTAALEGACRGLGGGPILGTRSCKNTWLRSYCNRWGTTGTRSCTMPWGAVWLLRIPETPRLLV